MPLLVWLVPLERRAAMAAVDLNGNGMSDIWEVLYGATNLPPAGDADGDGVSNLQESIAGTNPFDSNSVPRIVSLSFSGTNVNVSMPAALGKRYELQSLAAVGNGSETNWLTEASVTARTGTVVTLSAPANSVAKFFRISVSDVDTDGDGVNDWEEYQLGLNPFDPFSNGHLDAQGQPMNDYVYVTKAYQNAVTIRAADSTVTEPVPGQTASNTGLFTITRGGFPFRAITLNLGLSAPGPGIAVEGLDFAPVPRSITLPAGVSSQTLSLTPLANTNLASAALATLTLQPGFGYVAGSPGNASILLYPSPIPSGTGLNAQYFSGAGTVYSDPANFNPTNLALTRLDPAIDFVWGSSPVPAGGPCTVRWTGLVQPDFSERYTLTTRSADGVRLWVNGQLLIDDWVPQLVAEFSGSLNLQAGVRYPIRLEYFNRTNSAEAHLFWSSPSQPRQVIPSSHLYPAATGAAPLAISSPLTAVAFLGQPFSYYVTAVNSPVGYSAGTLPPGLVLNTTNGLLSGTPSLAGDYQITFSVSNASSVASSLLDLQVVDPSNSAPGQVWREVWLSVPGTNIADIPLDTGPSLNAALPALEGITDYGDNYGERIRGYLTPPVSGNYYFWLAGSDAAELWISNDSEPVNKVRRAWVLPEPSPASPSLNGTPSRQWSLQPHQRSPWLALTGGQRYYVEVLHKAGVGAGDNWAVAWSLDPSGTNTVPDATVPPEDLTLYFPPPVSVIPGTLFAANMLAQGAVASTASGSASLRLSADGSQAVLKFSASGLSSPVTGQHIHSDLYRGNPGQILFDIDSAVPQPDGSYVWQIGPVGALSSADILEIIQEGMSFINIHTVNNPGGEINGHFTPAIGTPVFTPPPAPPAWADDHADPNAAARFLLQTTFGPAPPDIAAVQTIGYQAWLDNQFALPASHHLPLVQAAVPGPPYLDYLLTGAWWQRSVTSPDQLRQRVAFALSEIMVISANNASLDNQGDLVSNYYDTLLDNAFGNCRTLLESVTLSPAMGLYLNMLGNDKANPALNTHPNQNYAREILQLFSIGLSRLWPDGSLVLDSLGSPVPTYSQPVIMGFADVFTGWNYSQPNQPGGLLPSNWYPPPNHLAPMVLVPTHHEPRAKLLLDNVVLPPAQNTQAGPAFDAFCLQDLEASLDAIFYHPNVGPFISRRLIQRLVTSNPSRDYVYRVAQKFNDNGCGVRGDLQAVLKAILLDYEARSSSMVALPEYGKQREPVLRASATARAFLASDTAGAYSETVSPTLQITTTNAHRLANGESIVLHFTNASGQPAPVSQSYAVTVTGPNTFTVADTNLSTAAFLQTNNGAVLLGTVALQRSSWIMYDTDASLDQTPMRTPSVFNFFSPDFQFPGQLAAAGLTTPEFQLTSDTTVASQIDFLSGGLLANPANTNGLSSLANGSGAVVLDVQPWMTPAYTATAAGIGSLVDALNTLLLAGQLSANARTVIVNYAGDPANFPCDSPPTSPQMRDRVQAVVQLLINSPDFTIQK